MSQEDNEPRPLFDARHPGLHDLTCTALAQAAHIEDVLPVIEEGIKQLQQAIPAESE